MEKLTIEHLSPYLPYGLKIKHNKTNDIFVIDGVLSFSDRIVCSELGKLNEIDLPLVKPILRPLSFLSDSELINIGLMLREIEIGKETSNDRVFAIKDAFYFLSKMKSTLSLNQSQRITTYLFSIKADVFGLIEKGLAIPVTNELNPY